MKKTILIVLLSILLIPKLQAQDDGLLGAAVGLAAIGSAIIAIDQMKEQAELEATEWLLNNRPEMSSFSLKTLDFDGKKAKDMSSVTVITYKIQEFQLRDKPELDGKKHVLFGFTSYGWANEMGVDLSRVRWHMIDADEWMNMMVAYVKTASNEREDSKIKQNLKTGKIVNKGIKESFDYTIPFYRLDGDMYAVRDYNDMMKLIYNERSLGIYLKETSNLVQIGRGDIIKIHDFFNEDD
ncbi:hypothetical protein [Rasiella sp. SM2506]|uniref:hypothetical protein n=1 Tax=Rasiella sp. SM2506 TaxID=3423914 RepID=UPI003D796C8F